MADPDATEHDRKTSHDHNTRKRKRVSYVELLDPEASDLSDEEEEEYGQKPLKRVKISKSKSRAAVKKIDKKPKKPFPFLLLPRELRDMIYELALCDSNGILLASRPRGLEQVAQRIPHNLGKAFEGKYHATYPGHMRQNKGEPKPIAKLAAGLIRSCRQISEESLFVLYSQPLGFSCLVTLYQFLVEIGSTNTKLLRNIVIKDYTDGGTQKHMADPTFRLLAPATGLREFTFSCTMGYGSGRPRGTNQLAYTVLRVALPYIKSHVEWELHQEEEEESAEDRVAEDILSIFRVHPKNFEGRWSSYSWGSVANPAGGEGLMAAQDDFEEALLTMIRTHINENYMVELEEDGKVD